MTVISKKKNSSPEIKTFGCRLNIWESQVISDHASNHGHSDLVIFNTCAVTSEAERQARQSIRAAKKNRPNAKILVTGCAAQIDPQKWSNMPEVNFVIGNKEKLEEKFWKNFDVNYDNDTNKNVIVTDIMEIKNNSSANMVLQNLSDVNFSNNDDLITIPKNGKINLQVKTLENLES